MPSSNQPTDDDVSIPHPRDDARSSDDGPTTPKPKKQPSPGATPKSAPAAAGTGAAAAAAAAAAASRPRSNSKKPEPTLLVDFLKGRPSPARQAAERRRRQSVEAVKAELRQEMRQGSVRKLQPPGGVRDRVSAWQRANASAAAKGDPDDAATEPPDVAFAGDDVESVTEEDRIRIRMRQKRRPPPRVKPVVHNDTDPSASTTNTADETPDSRPNAPPKKRVVSDEHWRKPKAHKNGLRKVSPKASKSPSPNPIPADFVQRSAPNPNVSGKIKAWASKVEIPDAPPPRSYRSTHSRKSARSEATSDGADTSSQTTAKHGVRPLDDDGIRVTPQKLDDGIRVTGSNPVAPNTDGARVRPMSAGFAKKKTADAPLASRARSKTTTSERGGSDRIVVEESDLSRTTQTKSQSNSDYIEVIEEPDSLLDTPTKRPASRRRLSPKPRPKSMADTSKLSTEPSSLEDEGSNLSSAYNASDLSSMANKSVADISGDIPFGHSAFSELDLSLNKTRPKRPKVDRNSSLKGMPNVFKKVVEEGKKMIHDINEPPKASVANKPPSIEKWLNNTVDPFVDDSKATQKPAEKHQKTEEAKSRRRASQEVRPRQSTPKTEDAEDQENTAPLTESTDTVTEVTPKAKADNGLKRSRATRSSSSPLKPGVRRPFFGVLKEAFQGESSGQSYPKTYQGQEPRSDYDDTDSYHSSDYTSGGLTDIRDEEDTPKMAGPRYKPPTNGRHELSTILSEDDSSALGSDLTDNSQSTLTQSTVLTKDSEPTKPQNHAPGLKRRLTRHSDLVSVLSLPDNSTIPSGIRNNRSRPSLRKTRTGSSDVMSDELLRELVDDENLYLRELKTLVDGVIPVLLTHVVNGTNSTELFGAGSSSKDGLSKSVVNMGVALEKLKNAHRKAPTSDIRRLANWAHGVVPIYNSYLSAWRLGFEDVVVNLAPGQLDDEDSLLNALPRNERGDIVDSTGERVAVAHLLKRPLIRVKQMTKFIKCVDAIVDSNDTHELLRDFEALQDKARRRHREETARMTDQDAINTDTTRARELRTLGAAGAITIDPSRQVNAKDIFALDLTHSNGQRLECQVELVHRDNQKHADEGDLLIRETGEGRRCFLLFAPVPMSMVSARTGDGELDMVVMIRGVHNGKSWHELITLSADSEDQILDWLDILPLSPVPPREPEPSEVGEPEPTTPRGPTDMPVGARVPLPESPRSPISKDFAPPTDDRRSLPSRYRPHRATMPSSFPSQASPKLGDPVKTPTKDAEEERSRPLSESMRPDPRSLRGESAPPNTTPFRDDGAPPPPVHRTLSVSAKPADKSTSQQQSPPLLQPPTDANNSERIRRRGSSPLKHEYLPSDVSSVSEEFSDESDAESSDDDIESIDIPETELGVSINKDVRAPPVGESLLSASDCSLTPSNSASQAGLHGPKTADENAARFVASISRWSDKGQWKDLSSNACSIVVTAGLIEVYPFRNGEHKKTDKPVLALDLTPLVLIRQSTALDLEIRSSVQPHSSLYEHYSGGNFRFRCPNHPECQGLYMAVHKARLNNQKFIQLENEARFKSFGEQRAPVENEGSTSSRRRSWFGRKNSYRSSVRAPSHDGASTTPSSTPSASSFLKRLTGGGNLSFNLARSSVDRQSLRSGGDSLYTLGSSSASGTPPRSPSVSVENSGRNTPSLNPDSIRIRLHLLVGAAKWEDYGNCSLQIRRPPPGWRQALRADHGLEKRVTATTLPKKESEQARIVLDAVLGSGCFSPMGSRGIVCGVWEEVRNGDGVVGMVPATGATGGNIKKWCFQFANAPEASWVLRLVHQEVVRA
ncbi:mpv17 / PMP22 family domain-containing protein [Purpureocillium lavendulum]|uniref:Mpv17 / PMP22 family domain-containing protein n=1 Tax=Purpureocillium lavendulum TaxID=1247861 RepID=A0AB34FTV5_9HYPO|nr:mpv17 / PMP22 family domain-containing protein [Purpureocillium lavendulum]